MGAWGRRGGTFLEKGFLLSSPNYTILLLKHTLEDVPFVAEIELGIKQPGEGLLAEAAVDFGIGLDEFRERLTGLPALHGVALHHDVGFLTRNARLDERGEHPLREIEAKRALQVAGHVLGHDAQPFEQAAKAVQHVIREDRGVGHESRAPQRNG